MMRILLINKFLYPKGGDAIVTLDTGKLLSERGHTVSFWGMEHAENGDFEYRDDFLPYVDLNARARILDQVGIACNTLYSFPAKERLERVLDKFKPDIVHLHNIAHQISPSIIDLIRGRGIPCVMTMHDYKLVCASYKLLSQDHPCEKCTNGRYYHCFQEACVKGSAVKSLVNTVEMYLHHRVLRIYDHVAAFISPSRFLKSKLEEMGFKREINVLPNFIKADRDEPDYEFKERSVIYFGRLSNEKGLETLIRAFKYLPDIQLRVIGDGPLKGSLLDQTSAENVENVHFLAHMSTGALKKEIANSMFTVVPSEWYENNPRSIIESFSLGKPVIGADIGGIPELVRENETGLTFISGNVEDLCGKIGYLADRPLEIKRMGIAARQFVNERFNADDHYSALIDIYRRALNGYA